MNEEKTNFFQSLKKTFHISSLINKKNFIARKDINAFAIACKENNIFIVKRV